MSNDEANKDVQAIAEETSRRIQPDDPMTEPPNSTVDDWLGQEVERDRERIETSRGGTDPDAPGSGVDDGTSDAVPEPNEPA